MVNKSDEMIYVTGQEGLDEYENLNATCGVSFPVNVLTSSEMLTTAKSDNDDFVVEAISTDGGVYTQEL